MSLFLVVTGALRDLIIDVFLEGCALVDSRVLPLCFSFLSVIPPLFLSFDSKSVSINTSISPSFLFTLVDLANADFFSDVLESSRLRPTRENRWVGVDSFFKLSWTEGSRGEVKRYSAPP